MIPGEVIPAEGEITLNEGAEAVVLMVANTGDRPVQVGSHYHFAETNPALEFDRVAAQGRRLDIAAGTAVRFEPGQRREVALVPYGGKRQVFGFNGKVMGALALVLALMLPQVSEAQDCYNAGAQVQMNDCAYQQYQFADAALNAEWPHAMGYARSIGQGDALLGAQRLWISYRDAACAVQASPFDGGSIAPFIRASCLTDLTVTRTQMLFDFRRP